MSSNLQANSHQPLMEELDDQNRIGGNENEKNTPAGARLDTKRLDPFYLYLRFVEQLGAGQAFLLDAAADPTSLYQMSLVAGAPVLEVQVKDGATSVYALEGLDDYLVNALEAEGIHQSEGEPTSGVEFAVTADSVVSTKPILYTESDPMLILEQLRRAMRQLYGETFLDPFSAGFLGYIGYDAVHYLEKLPKTTEDDRNLPDIRLQSHAVIVQLVESKVSVYSGIQALDSVLSESSKRYVQSQVEMVEMILGSAEVYAEPSLLQSVRERPETGLTGDGRTAEADVRTREDGRGAAGDVRTIADSRGVAADARAADDVVQETFENNVERAKAYIAAGDIFQVVLSKRVRVKRQRHAYVIYDELRRLNPSPYMFVAEYPDLRVFGASPEVQFRAVGGTAQMKPIAGTSKGRGKTPEEDARLADALFRDEKERAEHVMLVDLCRNDLGRVCQVGSVQVRDLMHVEAYSHLFHLVSEVTGQLRQDVSVFHALLATFPAGTLSGAPKIRAMEIIDELESLRRGPYGGMIGMIDFDANANTAIVIRTIIECQETYYVQVGAGIVADSNPTQEWLECGHKAGAVLQVLGVR